jgi:3-oxoacyl-[acyl-carrier protein] reductase
LDANLTSAYLTIRAASSALSDSGDGRVLTTGSDLGHRAMAGQSAYACAKAGLAMLTRVAAEELADQGVAVNELIPGPVDTGGFSDAFRTSVIDGGQEWLKDPEDVVPTALHILTMPTGGQRDRPSACYAARCDLHLLSPSVPPGTPPAISPHDTTDRRAPG